MIRKPILSICLILGMAACQGSGSAKFDTLTIVGEENGDGLAASEEVDEIQVAAINPASQNTAGTNPEDTVLVYNAPETGTVFTWRNNWANLPKYISYKVAGRLSKGETEYLKFTSVTGFKNTTHAFYDTSNFSLKGYRNSEDKAVVTFKPPEQRYRFPMAPGDRWITKWKQLEHKTNRITSGGGIVQVVRWETLKLPAGEFRALKVRMPVQSDAPKGLTHHAWFSPELGVTVKEEIGGGIMSWSQILEKVERPG